MPATRDIKEPLTPRQMEFLSMAANGMTAQEIADAEFVSISTVNNALEQARQRAGARNTTHLVALCIAAGMIVYSDD